MRQGCVLLAMTVIARAALYAQDLPAPDGNEQALEVEPPLLIQSRNADGSLVLSKDASAPAADVDIEKLEHNLARAKRNAAGAEREFRAGIISKVEAEERALRVVRLEATLAEARLTAAKRAAAAEEIDLAAVTEAATRAAAERRRAEVEMAVRNLQRQQKLLALGSGRKADVNRAEKKLADLQQAQN